MDDEFNRYEVYTTAGSVYCYRDSGVLKNRFGLRDGAKLKLVETDLTAIRQNDLLLHPIEGRFSARQLCRIHRYLFGDIYFFAGHYRREDIMKGATRFLSWREIPPRLKVLLSKLREENCLTGCCFEEIIDRGAYYFAELNYIHPFREGNGRTIREFMRLLFDRNGYRVLWNAVEPEHLLAVMEESVYDITPLKGVLSRCLERK